jgi:phosphate uptake regulator
MQGNLDLGQMVWSLIQETMRAFANRDAEAARRLWEEDKVVDSGAYKIRRHVMVMLEGAHACSTARWPSDRCTALHLLLLSIHFIP